MATTSPLSALLALMLLVVEWFVGAIDAIVPIFWNAEGGAFTFVGSITGVGFAIAVTLLIIAMIRSLLRGSK